MFAFLLSLSTFILSPGFAEAISAGDQAFLRIDYPAAISIYEMTLQSEPDNVELLWRLSRAYVCMGEVADERQQMKLFKVAEEYARRCIALDSAKAEAHTWLAGALGYEAWYSGVAEQVRISHELIAELDRALALNPDDDIAYSIRGSFYRALGHVGWLKRQIAALFLGGIPAGGFEEGETALLKAAAISPRTMRHLYELGILYLDMNRKDDAKRVLQHASTLPVQTAIDRPRIVKIRKLLEKLDTNP